MEIQNSLGDLLKQLIIQHRNTMEMWDKLSSAMTTEQQNIIANLSDFNGNSFKVSVPSLKQMQRQIESLERDFGKLSGTDGSSVIRTKDGDFKKIVISSLLKEPDSLQEIESPVSFKIKNNWFFENFLNPLLYVDFDYSGKLPLNVKRAEITKFLLALDTDSKKQYFEQNYSLRNDIKYEDFLFDMERNGISYIVDTGEVPTATKENVYYGDFTVIRIYDETETITTNGNQEVVTRKKYELDTLRYNSKLSSQKYTQTLKIGDYLIVNKNNKNTKYKVDEIDTSKNTVVLSHVDGFDTISIGNQSLTYYGLEYSKVNIEVPIGFDNYVVMFIRPIDDNSNIVSNFYSPGTAFYTNQLKIKLDTNTELTLEEYYRDEVVDFGQFLIGFAKDNSTPAIFGEIPDAPILDKNNFKVVEVNKHLTQKTTISDLKKLHLEKNTLTSELTQFDNNINELKTKIASKSYTNDNEKYSDIGTLSSLELKKENKKASYNSLVMKITGYGTEEIANIKPKYRVRGFWPIPTPITNRRSKSQEIVQFLISYRYLSKDGDANPIEQLNFTDTDGTIKKGSFSDWIEYKTDVRKKEFDSATNSYIWSTEQVENSDVVNINQLDISIQKGETIEIRIKSISEAGFPTNPLTSNWSEVISVPFPDELAIEKVASEIVEQSQREAVKVELDQELNSLGIKKHLSDAYTIGGVDFAHKAKHIDSGFLLNNQPIDLFEKIKEQDLVISKLNAAISGSIENFDVYLVDEGGGKNKIKLGFKNQIFAGYYRDIIQNESIKMGAIITRVYKLVFENNSTSPLILDSLNKGNAGSLADITTISGVTYNYGLVPVGRQNYKFHETQKKGQFIYNRYSDVFNNNIYSSSVMSSLYNYPISNTDCVVTNSMFLTPFTLDVNSLYLHEDHPDVSSGTYGAIPIEMPFNANVNGVQSSYASGQKISFEQNDRYLIGEKSVGAFLYALVDDVNNSNVRVDGETIYSNKVIQPGQKIEIPIVFQFRMTDYYGDTTGGYGIGRIGGKTNITNLTYTKSIGIDFSTKFGGQQGFDLELSAKYSPEGITLLNTVQSTGSSLSDFTV